MNLIENNISSVPKVSIIIPLYNTEKYIVESVQSIISQTLKDIEIIIINDGSTDNSLEVVTKLASTDNRIQIYSKNNEGPSESRNMGMQKAKGQYIYFMDSDDLLEPETLASCYQRCEKESLDFVFFDATAFKEDKSQSLNDYYLRTNTLEANIVYTGEGVLNLLINSNLYRPSVWLCFIKRDYIESINLDFYSGIIHEDELFAAILHLNAQRVGYISAPYFRRRIRPNSITSKKFTMWNIDCYLIVISELIKYRHKKEGSYNTIIDKICSYILNPAIYRASSFSFNDKFNLLRQCYNKGFLKYITIKNIIILLFPYIIKLKSITK